MLLPERPQCCLGCGGAGVQKRLGERKGQRGQRAVAGAASDIALPRTLFDPSFCALGHGPLDLPMVESYLLVAIVGQSFGQFGRLEGFFPTTALGPSRLPGQRSFNKFPFIVASR